MNNTLVMVAQFHQTFDHPIAFGPDVQEDLKIRQLRIKLLFEELAELAEASDCKRTMSLLCDAYCVKLAETHGGIEMTPKEFREQTESILDSRNIQDGDNVDKTEELDALCDIQYVLNGKILTSGLQHVFDKGFKVVHLNNMRKAHRSEGHCRETIAALGGKPEEFTTVEKLGREGQFSENGNVYILQNQGGKVIKPHDHKKVDLDIEKLQDPYFLP